jgi:hypothetical protein
VISELKFTAVVAGFSHACGLERGGAAYCWGANDTAQLGDGTLKNSSLPLRVSTDVRFQTIGPAEDTRAQSALIALGTAGEAIGMVNLV